MDKEDYIYCIKDLILDILHLICIGIAITIIGTFLAILFSFFDSFSTAFMHVGTCVSIALLVNLVIVLPFGLLGVLFILKSEERNERKRKQNNYFFFLEIDLYLFFRSHFSIFRTNLFQEAILRSIIQKINGTIILPIRCIP